LHHTPAGWQVVPVSLDNPTSLNGSRIVTAILLADGDRLTAGGLHFRFEGERPQPRVEVPPPQPAVAAPADDSRTLRAEEFRGSPPRHAPAAPPVPVGAGVLVGRDESAGLVLDHPLVSRRHARITPRSGGVVVTDLVSANGTFVNRRRVSGSAALTPGDRIDVGPYTLRFTGTHLTPTSRAGNAELRGWRISRVVTERATGRPLTLLDDVSLVVRPGQFVCLLGPSGSGKSTLLAALSGRVKPDRGLVLVNDTDLYAGFDVLKRDLAVVPQKDLLYDALTVGEALAYTARLRLPPDSTAADVTREVGDLLATVGLTARRDIPIRQLSGGQLKRVSLANELIGRPTLIFLDEVTSGLDEQTDREMMALFRAMADGGKTVVCVTHSLAHVERACHGVVVLAPGGVLAFAGSPAEARAYFGVERLGDLYECLAAKAPVEWRDQFDGHPNAAAPPADGADECDEAGDRRSGSGPLTAVRQGWVLFQRRFRLLLRDRPAVLTLAVQTAAVAVALAVAFGDLSRVEIPLTQARDAVTLHFLLAVSAFWFGCNGAVKVLVADRPLYRRERAVNLSLTGYGAAAFALHAGIAVTQTVLLAGAVWWLCQPPGLGWPAVGVLALTAAAGTALGFALSAGAESEEQAVAAVPLVLIPQIVFGGVVVPLGGAAEWVAKVGITAYWGQRATTAHLPDEVAAHTGMEQADAGIAVGFLGLHLAAYLAVATVIMLARDRRAFRR
jgi:ABC-type multidrug transport system ATPase subunit